MLNMINSTYKLNVTQTGKWVAARRWLPYKDNTISFLFEKSKLFSTTQAMFLYVSQLIMIMWLVKGMHLYS